MKVPLSLAILKIQLFFERMRLSCHKPLSWAVNEPEATHITVPLEALIMIEYFSWPFRECHLTIESVHDCLDVCGVVHYCIRLQKRRAFLASGEQPDLLKGDVLAR